MRIAGPLALLPLLSCARFDVRELFPPHALAAGAPLTRVGILVLPLGELSGPPAMSSGLTSFLPEPLADLAAATPILAPGRKEAPGWLVEARRSRALAAALTETLLGYVPAEIAGRRPFWALSEEAVALSLARQQGLTAVLVVRASVGPDDDQELPARLAAAAEVSLLDPARSETLARGYDRVSVRVSGRNVPHTLRRAGRELGTRLRRALRFGPPAEVEDEDEDAEE